jgi:hypothetical protein
VVGKSGGIWGGLEGEGGSLELEAVAYVDGTRLRARGGEEFAVEIEVRGGTFQGWGVAVGVWEIEVRATDSVSERSKIGVCRVLWAEAWSAGESATPRRA